MGKALLLYVLALAALGLAAWQPAVSWLSPVAMFLLLPGAAIWLWRSEGRSLWDLGFRPGANWWRNLGQGFFIGLIVPFTLTFLLAASGTIALVTATWPGTLLQGILFGVLMGIVRTAFSVASEEFVFRGFFLQRFGFAWGAWPAVLLSSVLFSLAHIPAMLKSGLSPTPLAIGLLSWLVFGVALAWTFLRTGRRLWFPCGMHYGYNFLYSLSAFVVSAVRGAPTELVYQGPSWWVGDPTWAPESGLLGLVLELGILVVVWVVLSLHLFGNDSRG